MVSDIIKLLRRIVIEAGRLFSMMFPIFFLFSCEYYVKPDLEVTHFPTSGNVLYQELGDPIISYTKAKTLPAILISQPIEFKSEPYELEVPPGRHVAFMVNKHGTSFKCKINVTQLDKTEEVWGGIFIPNDAEDNAQIFFKLDETKRLKIPQKISYIQTVAYQDAPDNFTQELIYHGKNKNVVKFIYREYRGSMSQEIFSQEIAYDFQPDSVIEFKGARFKIIEADNFKVQYVVLKNFVE
jgi:hypothetical protein